MKSKFWMYTFNIFRKFWRFKTYHEEDGAAT